MKASEANRLTTEVISRGLWPERALANVLGVIESVATLGGNMAVVPKITGNGDLENELKKNLKDLGYSCYHGDSYHIVVRW